MRRVVVNSLPPPEDSNEPFIFDVGLAESCFDLAEFSEALVRGGAREVTSCMSRAAKRDMEVPLEDSLNPLMEVDPRFKSSRGMALSSSSRITV